MADFTSSGWSLYIIVATALSLAACLWLTLSLSRKNEPGGQVGTTGHKWDETLEEYNHPLPRWWVYLFYITIAFAAVYLVLYPGLGAMQGTFGWSQTGQYEREVAKVNERVGPLFEKYLKQDIKAVAADPEARAMGERLFLTYCAQCHGSDARGSKGFPNLADNEWQWGGEPERIEETLLNGRTGMMPPMGTMLGGPAEVENVSHYVMSLSGSAHDALKAELGRAKFATCTACHGPEGKGNPALGAPNLTDAIWLHGSSRASVIEAIEKGRHNQMPAFKAFLGEGKVRVLAAYVWGLSSGDGKGARPQ